MIRIISLIVIVCLSLGTGISANDKIALKSELEKPEMAVAVWDFLKDYSIAAVLKNSPSSSSSLLTLGARIIELVKMYNVLAKEYISKDIVISVKGISNTEYNLIVNWRNEEIKITVTDKAGNIEENIENEIKGCLNKILFLIKADIDISMSKFERISKNIATPGLGVKLRLKDEGGTEAFFRKNELSMYIEVSQSSVFGFMMPSPSIRFYFNNDGTFEKLKLNFDLDAFLGKHLGEFYYVAYNKSDDSSSQCTLYKTAGDGFFKNVGIFDSSFVDVISFGESGYILTYNLLTSSKEESSVLYKINPNGSLLKVFSVDGSGIFNKIKLLYVGGVVYVRYQPNARVYTLLKRQEDDSFAVVQNCKNVLGVSVVSYGGSVYYGVSNEADTANGETMSCTLYRNAGVDGGDLELVKTFSDATDIDIIPSGGRLYVKVSDSNGRHALWQKKSDDTFIEEINDACNIFLIKGAKNSTYFEIVKNGERLYKFCDDTTDDFHNILKLTGYNYEIFEKIIYVVVDTLNEKMVKEYSTDGEFICEEIFENATDIHVEPYGSHVYFIVYYKHEIRIYEKQSNVHDSGKIIVKQNQNESHEFSSFENEEKWEKESNLNRVLTFKKPRPEYVCTLEKFGGVMYAIFGCYEDQKRRLYFYERQPNGTFANLDLECNRKDSKVVCCGGSVYFIIQDSDGIKIYERLPIDLEKQSPVSSFTRLQKGFEFYKGFKIYNIINNEINKQVFLSNILHAEGISPKILNSNFGMYLLANMTLEEIKEIQNLCSKLKGNPLAFLINAFTGDINDGSLVGYLRREILSKKNDKEQKEAFGNYLSLVKFLGEKGEVFDTEVWKNVIKPYLSNEDALSLLDFWGNARDALFLQNEKDVIYKLLAIPILVKEVGANIVETIWKAMFLNRGKMDDSVRLPLIRKITCAV